MAYRWKPLKELTSWRKISVGMWNSPSDPTIYGHEDLDVTEALAYLEELNAVVDTKVSVTALVVKAFADAMAMYPELNVFIVNGRLQARDTIDAFCQVAIPDPNGGPADLSGVKISRANELDIVQIAERLSSRAKKVRAGEDEEIERTKKTIDFVPPILIKQMIKVVDFLTYNIPIDLDGLGIRSDPFGSFMVSSIASFDLRLGYAPLVPASRCPLVALPGAIRMEPKVVGDKVLPRATLTVGTTFDHRCYDGYQIGHFVRFVRSYLTNPRPYLPDPSYWAAPAASETKKRRPEDKKATGGR